MGQYIREGVDDGVRFALAEKATNVQIENWRDLSCPPIWEFHGDRHLFYF